MREIKLMMYVWNSVSFFHFDKIMCIFWYQTWQTNRELPPHPNVVHLFGVSLDGPQPVIVLEYCAGGIHRIKPNHKYTSQFFIWMWRKFHNFSNFLID
jgi:hypothetical protein